MVIKVCDKNFSLSLILRVFHTPPLASNCLCKQNMSPYVERAELSLWRHILAVFKCTPVDCTQSPAKKVNTSRSPASWRSSCPPAPSAQPPRRSLVSQPEPRGTSFAQPPVRGDSFRRNHPRCPEQFHSFLWSGLRPAAHVRLHLGCCWELGRLQRGVCL